MKKLLIFILLFSLVGCKNTNNINNNTTNNNINNNENLEDDDKEETSPMETIVKNDYGYMNETWGTYQPLLNEKLVFETKNHEYHYDLLAIRFDEEKNIDLDFQAHLSGKFTYYYNNKEYILNLNNVLIGYIFYGENVSAFFFIEVDDNEVRYTLRGNAKLEINQIWQFVPYNN